MESRKRQELLRQLIFQVRLISKKPCKNDCFSQGLFVWKEYFYNNLLEPSMINMVYPNISPINPMIIPTFSISFC